MNKIYFPIIILSLVTLSGCTPFTTTNTNPPTLAPSPTPHLVGGDKDAHGCIGSAGYSWCEPKQKCLRTWEESCDSPTPTLVPTVDETSIIKTSVKQALVAKHGNNANSLAISVSKIIGNYSSGGASASDGGGMWFAAKVGGQWQLVWDGNGTILCQDLVSYPDFPPSIIPECYNQKTGKSVTR